MYIPAPTISRPSAFLFDDSNDSQDQKEKWSSLIGVVTAIIGNVLISFALNTQRYAHLRLSREREEQEEKQRRARGRWQRHKKGIGYGTQQKDIAEERAEVNAKAEPMRDDLEAGQRDGRGETEPLIPRIGKNDQKGAASKEGGEDGDGEAKERSYLQSPIWWVGITLMTIGEAGNFLAYGFAPASIVSPMGVVALVSNCLIAPLLLHERFRWRDGLGVIIAVGGCVTVVLSASDSNPRLGPDEIWDLITQWEFETYLGITVFLIIVLAFASNKFGDRTILIDLGLVGLFGGYTALSTKGVASLLSNTIWRAVTFPITYLLVAVLVSTAIMQIKYVNRALQRFNSTMVIPTQFVLFTISVILGSAILYRDFERTTPEDAGKFVGGCALTFLGVWCITSGRNDNQDESDEEMELGEEEEEEEEEAVNLIDEEGQQPETRERDLTDGRRASIIGSSSKSTPKLAPIPDDDDEDKAGTSYKSSYFTPQTHPYETLPPATASAIHSSSTSDLPGDVPSELARRNLQPPPLHATTSAPVVPTTADANAPARPHTPLRRGITHTEGSPSHSPVTPRRRPSTQQQQYLDPTVERQKLLNRHSVAGLLPAPYTSPLSSSLSAIVADSLRREPSSSSPLRRRSTRFRRKGTGELTTPSAMGAGGGAAGPKRHSIASGEFPLDRDEDENSETPAAGRLRSLSATLGEAFGGGKANTKAKTGGAAVAGIRRESVVASLEEDGEGPGRS